MAAEPLPTGLNGRDPAGRFAAGNRAARGNPNNRKVQALRNALLRAVSVKDLREVVAALLGKAKAGDVPAIRELNDRLMGKAVASLELSSPDGTLGAQAVVAAVLEALADVPEVKARVAKRLMELSHGPAGTNGAGS